MINTPLRLAHEAVRMTVWPNMPMGGFVVHQTAVTPQLLSN